MKYRHPNIVLRTIFASTVLATLAVAQTLPTPLQGLETYDLVFSDNFTSFNLSPDGKGVYTWYQGIWFNPLLAPVSNIATSNSGLTLTWTRGQTAMDTTVSTMSRDALNYHAWRYGYFEARMKWDLDTGAWPAFWLLPVQDATRVDLYNGVRESGEIDIFEGKGDRPHNYYATLHDWVNDVDAMIGQNNVFPIAASIDLSQFHTYSLLWVPGQVTWYLDGQPIRTATPPAICDKQDFFINLSMQEGENWTPGNLTDVTASSMHLTVQWVHVWQPLVASRYFYKSPR